ncbi:hypothetical protein CR51_28800 [Caballeronia megalochromosomata]|nr:hypothetical protein CR51_28800 [Caballeronia megalochromosomata]
MNLNRKSVNKFIDLLATYDIYELADSIDPSSVEDINNIAYFLSENNRSYDAIILLQKIVQEFPDRTVAKLNLADAYWNTHLDEQGIKMYKEYVAQMTARGLERKIPRHVIMRIDRKSRKSETSEE